MIDTHIERDIHINLKLTIQIVVIALKCDSISHLTQLERGKCWISHFRLTNRVTSGSESSIRFHHILRGIRYVAALQNARMQLERFHQNRNRTQQFVSLKNLKNKNETAVDLHIA